MKKIIFILIIIFLGILILISYQNLQYEKALTKVKKTYNEEQEQCDIVGATENYLYISRYFNDAKDYSNWLLTNIKTKKTYKFSLNTNGKGGLVGLKNGEYTLKELSNSSELDTNEYYLKFSENNKSYHFSPTSMDERAFVVLVLDKNGNRVPNIKINVLDSFGRVFLSSKTNENGMIAFEHITADLCYIVQDGIDNPKKFFVKIEQDKVLGIKLHLNDEGVLE